MQNIRVEPTKQNDSGPCDCCGKMSRTVWGFLYVDETPRAVYYVQWTLGEVARHGANLDLILGNWSETATPAERFAVSIIYRVGPHGPELASIDPDGRPHLASGLAGHAIPGRHLLGNPVAADAYAFLHAVLGQDQRCAEIVSAAQV